MKSGQRNLQFLGRQDFGDDRAPHGVGDELARLLALVVDDLVQRRRIDLLGAGRQVEQVRVCVGRRAFEVAVEGDLPPVDGGPGGHLRGDDREEGLGHVLPALRR